MSNWPEIFARDGYLYLPSVFTLEQIQQLQADIETTASTLQSSSRLNKHNLLFYSNLYRHSEAIARVLLHQPIFAVLSKLSADDLWLRWDQCVKKLPGGSVFPLHRDNVYSKLTAEHLQVWVAITEMHQHNGTLEIVPGSHKWPPVKHRWKKGHWQTNVPKSKRQLVAAKPGDVLIFSSRLIHGTGANTTNQERVAYVAECLPVTVSDPFVSSPYWQLSKNGNPLGQWQNQMHPAKSSNTIADEKTVRWPWSKHRRVRLA